MWLLPKVKMYINMKKDTEILKLHPSNANL